MNLVDLRKQINSMPNPYTEDRTKVWFIDATQRQRLNEVIDQAEKVERYEKALKRIASDETVTFEQTEIIAKRALGMKPFNDLS